jgi:hypothetical protein
MRWDARPLHLWSMDCRIQNGRCPSLVLLMTSDCNLKDLETQDNSSTSLHRFQLLAKRYGSLTEPTDGIDSIDRMLPYLIPNFSRGMNAKTVPMTARIEQTIIKTQSKIRSRVLITSWKVFK